MDWNRYIEDFLREITIAGETERADLIQSLAQILQERDSLKIELSRFQSYLENASDTIAEMDNQGNIIYTTRNWVRQLGYTPDEVKSFSIFATLFHPEDAPKARIYLQQAFDTQKTQTGLEYRIRHKNGEYRWHTANLSPVFDENGKVSSIIAIAHSVHERKMAELQLQKRERLYRLLLNTMQEAVLMVDNDDVIKYVNPRCCELFGQAETDLLGKKGFECLITAEDQHLVLDKNQQRLHGLIDVYELRGRKKDGTVIWLRVSGAPVLDDDRRVIGSVGIMTDITESKMTMDALKRSEEKYRNIFDNSMAGVFQSTLEDKYLNVNKRMAEMAGYNSPQEMIDEIKDIKDIYVNPGERELLKELLLQNGTLQNYEVELKRKDGSNFWASLSARFFTNDEGQTIVEGAAIDVSESKSLREQLLASQKMDAVGKLAGGVAHDFNNLLTIILGYSEDLLEELPQNSSLREPAEEIVKAGVRAAKLTRQLLAFSKKQVIQSQALDMNSQLNNLKGIFVRLLGENVALRYSLASDLKLVKADPGQIEQALVNLVLNAKEAMPEGGELHIRTQNEKIEADNPISHLGLKPGDYILVSLTDTGTGIPESIKHKIFEPFFSTKEDSRGLGLATVWGIVTQSGGHIKLESDFQQGTLVSLYLPVSSQVDPTRLRLKMPDLGKRETIMVVEDEEALCLLIKKMLSNLGYEVIAFSRPQDALNYFQTSDPPDLMITDIIMPEMNGKQLIDAVHKIHAEQKVLVVSGFTDDVIAQHGILDENIPFMGKPFTSAQIAPIIRDILTKQHNNRRILVWDAESALKSLIQRSCRKRGFACDAFSEIEAALHSLREHSYDAIVVDLGTRPEQNISSIRQIRQVSPELPLVLICPSMQESVMESLQDFNALCVIEKQPDHNKLVDYLEQILRTHLN